ncbi:MAG: hypothetical protein ACOC3F_02590, partial [Desulfosudaceae bacterium]
CAGWWLAEQDDGQRAAMATRRVDCIDCVRTGTLRIFWSAGSSGTVKLDSLRHTTDPAEVIAWLRGEEM